MYSRSDAVKSLMLGNSPPHGCGREHVEVKWTVQRWYLASGNTFPTPIGSKDALRPFLAQKQLPVERKRSDRELKRGPELAGEGNHPCPAYTVQVKIDPAVKGEFGRKRRAPLYAGEVYRPP